MISKKEEFIRGLYRTGSVKFGNFTLKSGIQSPFYLDLRKIISHPDLHNLMCELLSDYAKKLDFDCVLGIPYTALPSAALIAQKLEKPLFMLRKEEKKYGAGGTLVGDSEKIGKCLIVDDLITTGKSKFETTNQLTKMGFKVEDILVVVDRSARASVELQEQGLNLHSLITLNEIMKILTADGSLEKTRAKEILDFTVLLPEKEKKLKADISVEENLFTKKLKEIMARKKTNLILSLDTASSIDFFNILEKTADSIAMVKTHVDIIKDFTPVFLEKLIELSIKKDFLIFEDRKFADIGNTVKHQFSGGIYHIADWADCVTSHLVAGEGTIKGLFPEGEKSFKQNKPQAVFLLARMSSKGNLITEDYSKRVIEVGAENNKIVSGYIGHGKDVEDLKKYKKMIPKGQLFLMPGVKLERGGDKLGQQYLTVEEAINGGADCIIVGRGIISAKNPSAEAEIYRNRAWNTYIKRSL